MRVIILLLVLSSSSNFAYADEKLSPVNISLSDDIYVACNDEAENILYKFPGVKVSSNEVFNISFGEFLKVEELSFMEKPFRIMKNWKKVSIGGSFDVKGWIITEKYCHLK